MEITSEVGEDGVIDIIRLIIKGRKLKQREIASNIGVTESALSYWLGKKRRMPFWVTLELLNALGYKITIEEK